MLAAIRNHYPDSSGREQTSETKTEHGGRSNKNLNQKFLQAAKVGNFEQLDSMIQTGVNVNVTNSSDDTALIFASEKGHNACVDLLINAGADVNIHGTNGSTGLILAAENGHDECVKSLIKAGACVNERETDIFQSTALMCAVREGKITV